VRVVRRLYAVILIITPVLKAASSIAAMPLAA